MHHFRGKLLEDDQVRLDPASIYIQFHNEEKAGAQGWYGYLALKTESDLEPGAEYTLRLDDGRAGALRIDTIAADDAGQFRAAFIGDGPLK